MWYKINFDRLILLLLPTFLRKPVLFAYLKALLSPVANLHYQWNVGRDSNLAKMSYNGQRCYLRKLLNDKCDTDLRRIYIDEVPVQYENFLYQPGENLDFYLDTMWLDLDYSYQGERVDFVVYVPFSVLELNKNIIDALLDFYKLAGKTYKIIGI